MEEREHILKILENVKSALKEKNTLKIKQLSNEIIHNASIYQDPDIISTTIIIYSLSKILERKDYKEHKSWSNFYREYLEHITKATNALQKENIPEFRKEIKSTRDSIDKLSGKLKFYIQDVFRKAKINKASRIYEHGISMEKTAKILGISIWELAEYTGQTRIADVNLAVTMPLKQRIKLAEEIFE